jgi:Arm DNA-binding domain
MHHGKAREMSLGSLENVTLSEARDQASDARKLLAQGIDPLDQRHAEQGLRSQRSRCILRRLPKRRSDLSLAMSLPGGTPNTGNRSGIRSPHTPLR